MKKNPFKLTFLIILLMVISCDEPETVVTNIVHSDGSVTRKIEMRNIKNKFDLSNIQVPFDDTWTIKDSIEIGTKGDTTWVKRAEKLFKNTDGINSLYKLDTGTNKIAVRHAGFRKRFRWFNTEFRFSETIDQRLAAAYPVKDFLNEEELLYFYSPEKLKYDKEHGPDSLKYRALRDSISHNTDIWTIKNIVSLWISDFAKLTRSSGTRDLSLDSLKAREGDLVKIVVSNGEKFDSLWKNGMLLKEFVGGPNALKYSKEADSALTLATESILIDFKDYSVQIVMPGKLTGTNGFIDSSNVLTWPVNGDYFLTQPYDMWAESKQPNRWAWIVSGLFLLFVITGVIMRTNKKG